MIPVHACLLRTIVAVMPSRVLLSGLILLFLVLDNASEPVRVDVQKIKIVLFGSQRVGKSSLVKRWLQNSFDADPESYVPTQKVSISSKLMALDNLMLAVEVWDTPSHPDIRDKYVITFGRCFSYASPCVIL